MSKVTLSVIKADVGGFVGHSSVHPNLLAAAKTTSRVGRTPYRLHVDHVGDDIGSS